MYLAIGVKTGQAKCCDFVADTLPTFGQYQQAGTRVRRLSFTLAREAMLSGSNESG
jgi:hypothetical protein